MATFKLVILLGVVGCLASAAPLEDASDTLERFFPRIVGGTDSPHVPFMVALLFGNLFLTLICGGSLIAPHIVLSAAHCIEPMRSWNRPGLIESFHVLAGSRQWNKGGVVNIPKDYVIHPKYDAFTIKHDLGFLQMTDKFVISAQIAPISVHFEKRDGVIPCQVSGWGQQEFGGLVPYILQRLNVSTLYSHQCVAAVEAARESLGLWMPSIDIDIELCAIHKKGADFGMCYGDSGSALVDLILNKQIGLVSWGVPCGMGYPDMFVRLSYYEEFFKLIFEKFQWK